MQVAACRGHEGDATPFTSVTVDNIGFELTRLGFHNRGWETMYNGHTGRQLQARAPACVHPAGWARRCQQCSLLRLRNEQPCRRACHRGRRVQPLLGRTPAAVRRPRSS